jgi:hypothetical protein
VELFKIIDDQLSASNAENKDQDLGDAILAEPFPLPISVKS